MRDYLEELLAGTEDALDRAEAEWTEGASPPLPRRSGERRETPDGPAEPERDAGTGETAALGGKDRTQTEPEGRSVPGETGTAPESGERAEQLESPAGLGTASPALSPEEGASALSRLLWAGRQGRAAPREEGPEGPGAEAGKAPELPGAERASLWEREPEEASGARRLQAALGLARRRAEYRRAPGTARVEPLSLRPEAGEPLRLEHDSARRVDRIFRRDARRYDGGFALF